MYATSYRENNTTSLSLLQKSTLKPMTKNCNETLWVIFKHCGSPKSLRNQVRSLDDENDDGGDDGSKAVVLNITLQRQSSVQYQRRLIMEFEWFLGCIGGILALFTGFSLLSITQSIYKCGRDFCKKREERKKWDNVLANFDRRRANSDPGLR